MATDDPIAGIDQRPFIEVTDHEKAASDRWGKALKYAAFSSIAFVGVKFGATIKFQIDPKKLTYLTGGLDHLSQTPWYQVRGHTLVNGKIDATVGDFLLEGIKRAEEFGGGIGRTFGAFGMASRQLMTTQNTSLRLTGQDLEGAISHYEALVGRGLTPHETVAGFHVDPFSRDDLLSHIDTQAKQQGLVLTSQEVSDRADAMIKAGEAVPGKQVGLFSSNLDGSRGSLAIPNVQVGARRWNMTGDSINPDTGLPRHNHIIRDADAISESMGARPISHKNAAPYQVFKAPPKTTLTGTSRELVEAFIDPKHIENAIDKVGGQRGREAMQEGGAFMKRMSERYLRMLDQPLEALEDLLGQGPTLKKAQGSKPYKFYKNLFGTGGDYTGTTMDLWGRHLKRIVPLAIGAAAVYEAGSFITRAISGKDLAQVGGEAIGATQRLYSGLSDVTGLTKLNKYQEEKAEGSHRLAGVLAFPFAGYITGRVAGAATNPTQASAAKNAWQTAREEVHNLPDWLNFMKRDLPLVGDLSKPMTRGSKYGIIGATIGGALSLPFLLGSLGSNQSYQEVKAEQAGDTEVAVRKGAHWEGGRTDWEGENIQYHAPGWYRHLMDNPEGELQYGSMDERPFSRMLQGIFDPYAREKELYYTRPYTTTGPDTTSFGPLGTLWGMTLGRVLKPQKLMHVDEVSEGGREGVSAGEVAQFGRTLTEAPSGPLGGLKPAAARSPYEQSFLAGEMAYKASEAAGLPGFVFSSVKKALTGTPDFQDQDPVLSSFAEMGSMRDRFWDLNLGGGLLSTEAVRRFTPKERFQLQKVNPTSNEMPSWMSGPGNFIDFTHGDPFSAIPEGEYRLPGSGYAKRFPELSGMNPEDYPDIHRYKILGDVAPYSNEFKEVAKRVEAQASSGELSPEDTALYQATKAGMSARDQKVKFRKEPDSLMGSYWAALTKAGRMNPVEHLLPISPVHKFAGPTDSITEYEDRNLYSTRSPSWDSPIEDFIKPAMQNAAHILGYEGVPEAVQERRDLTEYFDKLEYLKFKRLENNARGQGEGRAAFAFSRKAEYTMFGADPYTDIDTVKKVLPSEEAPFFTQFLSETDPDKKGRILEMVPRYTRKFYTAQWQKQIYAGLAAKGNLSSDERQAVSSIESSRALEGLASDTSTWNDYQSGVDSGRVHPNSFPDYIRAKTLQSYFDGESPYDAPKADWLGYSSAVDMDDVKLKVVQNSGLDAHDFGLWEDDLARATRKPYLGDIANELESPNLIREDIVRSLTSMRMTDLDVEIVPNAGEKNRIILDVRNDRRPQINKELKRAGY